jgi:hypothetical protein
MLDKLVKEARSLTDEEAIGLYIGMFQRAMGRGEAAGAAADPLKTMDGFGEVVGKTLRHWALLQPRFPEFTEALVESAGDELVSECERTLRGFLAATGKCQSAAEVDATIKGAARDLAVRIVKDLSAAAVVGADMARAKIDAAGGGLQ